MTATYMPGKKGGGTGTKGGRSSLTAKVSYHIRHTSARQGRTTKCGAGIRLVSNFVLGSVRHVEYFL